MKIKLFTSLMFLTFCVSIGFAQGDLTIRKKTTMRFPEMPTMPAMPEGMMNPMKNLEDRKSVDYIKGSRMRTDMKYQQPKKGGGTETKTQTVIVQCDKNREIQFNSSKKKYYQESLSPETSATVKDAKKGGYVTITGKVTDTGERARLFGFDARHLKQSVTITPSKNACQKETMQIEIEGWYADIPEFSCPRKPNLREFNMGENCFDEVDLQMKGGITGIPLKEVKKISMMGMTMIIEEEATEISRTPLDAVLFEPPANYKAANKLEELEDDSPDDASAETTAVNEMPQTPPVVTSNPAPTFPLPAGGIEKSSPTEKTPGMIRIGVAQPEVTTPESKKDPDAGDDIAAATADSLLESLKAENVEAVRLETAYPENEAKEKKCDYILYANVTQKRGGGGMFKSMVLMGATTAAGMIVPGIGGMITSTAASILMGQTMGKEAKAKDEFTFGYKLVSPDKTVVSQAVTKAKTEKDGQDVLSQQIQQASKDVLAKIKK